MNPSASAPDRPDWIVEVDGLRRRFGAFEAVRGVSFQVRRGEIFGYLGANGAGKSTTIRMLIGLLAPSAGRAIVAGHDVGRSPVEVRRSVGYMSQKFSLYPDLSARQNLDFFGGAYGLDRRVRRRRAEVLFEQVGLAGHEDELAGRMPGGMRQRLALASALQHEPQIVFLDEPTAGVDPEARRSFFRLIRELAATGTTVFVTTHFLDEAEYCERVGLMVDGRLVALDTPERLKTTQVQGRMFAVRAEPGTRYGWEQTLLSLPGVFEAIPFGGAVHVRADLPVQAEALVDHARQQGLAVKVEAMVPTLEDVFLAVASHTGDA